MNIIERLATKSFRPSQPGISRVVFVSWSRLEALLIYCEAGVILKPSRAALTVVGIFEMFPETLSTRPGTEAICLTL